MIDMTAAVVGHLALAGALLGVLLLRRTGARALVVGLFFGYAAYVMLLTYPGFTHDYYHLQLIPIVALGLAQSATYEDLYSIEILPPFWEAVSHANPLFYIVNAVRYGFLGQSDVSVTLSFAVTAAIAALFVAWSQWLFVTGRKLKP